MSPLSKIPLCSLHAFSMQAADMHFEVPGRHSDGGSDIAAPETHNTPPRQLPLLCKVAKFAFKAVAHISRGT